MLKAERFPRTHLTQSYSYNHHSRASVPFVSTDQLVYEETSAKRIAKKIPVATRQRDVIKKVQLTFVKTSFSPVNSFIKRILPMTSFP